MQQTITLNSNWGLTSTTGMGTNLPSGDWYNPNLYQPIVKEYYPATIFTQWSEPNKTEKAFKVLQKLIETKRVQIDKVKDFIEAINEIVEVL